MFNTENQEHFLISQLIIDEIFDIYSIHLIPENDLKHNNEPKNDDKIDENNSDVPKKSKERELQLLMHNLFINYMIQKMTLYPKNYVIRLVIVSPLITTLLEKKVKLPRNIKILTEKKNGTMTTSSMH